MVHRTAYVENYSEYAVPKIPITKDDFSVDNFIDQDSVKIGVSGGVLNYNFVKDGTTDTSTRDLKVVSNNRWILRFNLVVNTLTNPSVGTSFGIIGISNKTTTGNENFIGMMIVRNSAGVGSYRALSTSNGLPISGNDSSIFTTIPTTSDNYFIEIKRESVNSARMTIFSDSAYTVVVESRVFTTAGGGAPIDQNIKDLRYIKLQNVIDNGIGGGSIAGTIDNLLFINEQLGVTFEDDFSGADNWTDNGSTIAVNTTTDVIDWLIGVGGDNNGTYYDLGSSVSNTNWTLRFKWDYVSKTGGTDGKILAFGIWDNNVFDNSTTQDFILFLFQTNTPNDKLYIESGNNVIFHGGLIDDHPVIPLIGTYYIELKRTSSTSCKLLVYSDSGYTNLLGSKIQTISSSLTGLRYLKTQFWDGGNTTVATGTIDNIEFFNGQGITFQDDLTTSTNWASTGTKVTISGGKINWDAKATDTLEQGVSHDFGVGVVNGKSWTLRFKFTVDTFVFQTSNSMDLVIGLFAEDHTKKADVTTTGWHGIYGNWAVTNPLENVAIITNDGSAITGGTLPLLLNFNQMYNSHATIQIAYCELKRTSATLAEFNIYQDPAYSVLLSKGIVAIQAGLTEDLRYLMVKTFDNAVIVGGSWSGTVDDVEFYNGIAPRPLLPRLIDTLQEDVSYYTTQGEADAKWVSSDTAKVRANITTDVIDFDFVRDNTNDCIVYDLGSGGVSDSNWVLQFKLRFTSLSFTDWAMFGISDSDQTAGRTTAQDFIGIQWTYETGVGSQVAFVADDNNNVALSLNLGLSGVGFNFTTGVDYYCKVHRTSSTTYYVEVFTDSAYTNSVGKQLGTMTSTLANLRYIKFVGPQFTGTTEAMAGTIDDIEFFNGVSVANTVKRPNPDVEFDFSTSNGWVQTGTGVSVNTTLGQIDGWSTDGAIDRHVTFDMGTGGILNELNWIVEFEYEWSASNVPAHAPLVISNNNQNTDFFAPVLSDDVIGVMHSDLFTFTNSLTIYTKDNLTASFSSNSIEIFANVRYYVRLERVKDTTVRLSIFSDPDFTQHITGSPTFLTVLSTIDNLRYIHSENLYSGSIIRTLTGFVKNLKIYRSVRGTDKDNKYLVIG